MNTRVNITLSEIVGLTRVYFCSKTYVVDTRCGGSGVWVSIESVELTQPGRLPGLGCRSGQVEDYSRVWQF